MPHYSGHMVPAGQVWETPTNTGFTVPLKAVKPHLVIEVARHVDDVGTIHNKVSNGLQNLARCRNLSSGLVTTAFLEPITPIKGEGEECNVRAIIRVYYGVR